MFYGAFLLLLYHVRMDRVLFGPKQGIWPESSVIFQTLGGSEHTYQFGTRGSGLLYLEVLGGLLESQGFRN